VRLWKGAGVEDQPEAAADVSRAQRGDVTADDPHRDAGSTDPPAGASHGRPDQLDAGHVPAALGRGPRMDPPQVEQFAARLDHAAIRVAHDDRGHFPGRDRDHGLVQ
jgi:hypothetical protein